MRVKILTLQAGPLGIRKPGDVVDLHPREAAALIDAHAAERVAEPAPPKLEPVAVVVETATAPAEVEARPAPVLRGRRGRKPRA